ncbi:hypothetical protein CD30_15730, partial [Ureibacillus massiliensis 4400831 = CIP 108448 = CCUG 49529]
MGRIPTTRKLPKAKQSNFTSSIIPSVLLFIFGMIIADSINPFQEVLSSTLVFLVFLIAINVGLFRYMRLHQAFQRTHRIQYWNLKQKSILFLYLFLIVLMLGELFEYCILNKPLVRNFEPL